MFVFDLKRPFTVVRFAVRRLMQDCECCCSLHDVRQHQAGCVLHPASGLQAPPTGAVRCAGVTAVGHHTGLASCVMAYRVLSRNVNFTVLMMDGYAGQCLSYVLQAPAPNAGLCAG